MTIRTILVDDEPLAIQGLQLRLQPHDDVEIVDTCSNGREAIRSIKTHKPDLVFLDIQMPGFDGFSVIQGLMEVEPPLFVFVTAYTDHAIRAFEAQAVDYLMKPVEEDRLADTLDRVRQRLAEKRGVEEVGRLKEVLAEVAPEAAENVEGVEDAHAANRYEKLINIKDRGQIFRVDVDTIEKIDAAGDYMCIYTGDNTLILRETMKDLEKRLDPRRFQRVHRSTIVNLDQVRRSSRTPTANASWCSIQGRAGEGQPLLSRRGGAVRPLWRKRPKRRIDQWLTRGERAWRRSPGWADYSTRSRTRKGRAAGIRRCSASAANGARPCPGRPMKPARPTASFTVQGDERLFRPEQFALHGQFPGRRSRLLHRRARSQGDRDTRPPE
jgi:two-component system LytT family response regulator